MPRDHGIEYTDRRACAFQLGAQAGKLVSSGSIPRHHGDPIQKSVNRARQNARIAALFQTENQFSARYRGHRKRPGGRRTSAASSAAEAPRIA